jgi:mRNA-degrading endonuclease YafQ of YafQ-DinJ toxin-antitoxin module
MVFYNTTVHADIEQIRYGLLNWGKIVLTEEFIENYIDKIKEVCESLDKRTYHLTSVYLSHQPYGKYVYKYHRNKQTTWYIIYNLDTDNNVYINKIISNYNTITGI